MKSSQKHGTREMPASRYEGYLRKAKEFYQTMYSAEKAENWNAVGLNGVHCVISLIDTLLVRYAGVRSIEDDHMAVIDLLTSSTTSKLNDVREKSQLARRVIAKKNLVAYENRSFLKTEALDMIKRVERFYRWAISQL